MSEESKMKNQLLRLWRDDRGTASIVSLIFITSIVAMGAIVGLVVLRNQVVQEFGDVAVALDQLNQSFSYTIRVDGNSDGDFLDPQDSILTASYADPAPTLTDPVNAPPAGLVLGGAATAEGAVIVGPTGAFP